MSAGFEGFVDRFQQEMAEIDPVVHVLLKGHLLLEEVLTAILEQHFFHPEHLPDRTTFADKLAFCRALCLRKAELGEWDLLLALNALRNELAHNLRSSKRDRKTRLVRDIYLREAASRPGLEASANADDAEVVMHACAHCNGFLQSFLEDAKALRGLLHRLDRDMNPRLPEFNR